MTELGMVETMEKAMETTKVLKAALVANPAHDNQVLFFASMGLAVTAAVQLRNMVPGFFKDYADMETWAVEMVKTALTEADHAEALKGTSAH